MRVLCNYGEVEGDDAATSHLASSIVALVFYGGSDPFDCR